MEETDIELQEATPQRDAKGRLVPGCKRLPGAGRAPGVKNWNARRVAESMGVSPLIVALTVLKTGYFPLAKGEKPEDQRRASPELFTKILLDTLKLCVPALSAVQVTGKDEGPVAVSTLNVTDLMADPALAEAAQLIALGLAQKDRLQAPGFPMLEARPISEDE